MGFTHSQKNSLLLDSVLDSVLGLLPQNVLLAFLYFKPFLFQLALWQLQWIVHYS